MNALTHWVTYIFKSSNLITNSNQLQDMDNQTPEERQVRLKKADSIRRMLAEQSGPAGNGMNSLGDSGSSMGDQSTMSAEARQQMEEEKQQRSHLLALSSRDPMR